MLAFSPPHPNAQLSTTAPLAYHYGQVSPESNTTLFKVSLACWCFLVFCLLSSCGFLGMGPHSTEQARTRAGEEPTCRVIAVVCVQEARANARAPKAASFLSNVSLMVLVRRAKGRSLNFRVSAPSFFRSG